MSDGIFTRESSVVHLSNHSDVLGTIPSVSKPRQASDFTHCIDQTDLIKNLISDNRNIPFSG